MNKDATSIIFVKGISIDEIESFKDELQKVINLNGTEGAIRFLSGRFPGRLFDLEERNMNGERIG